MDPILLAERLARAAHAGQVDAQGRDYVEYHVAPIARSLAPFGASAVAAGWLHDIVEDTRHTPRSLLGRGVAQHIADAVEAVSRYPSETYPELIERACANPLARVVKLADNTLNLLNNPGLAETDPDRADSLKYGRYLPARARLLDRIDEDWADIAHMQERLSRTVQRS